MASRTPATTRRRESFEGSREFPDIGRQRQGQESAAAISVRIQHRQQVQWQSRNLSRRRHPWHSHLGNLFITSGGAAATSSHGPRRRATSPAMPVAFWTTRRWPWGACHRPPSPITVSAAEGWSCHLPLFSSSVFCHWDLPLHPVAVAVPCRWSCPCFDLT